MWKSWCTPLVLILEFSTDTHLEDSRLASLDQTSPFVIPSSKYVNDKLSMITTKAEAFYKKITLKDIYNYKQS